MSQEDQESAGPARAEHGDATEAGTGVEPEETYPLAKAIEPEADEARVDTSPPKIDLAEILPAAREGRRIFAESTIRPRGSEERAEGGADAEVLDGEDVSARCEEPLGPRGQHDQEAIQVRTQALLESLEACAARQLEALEDQTRQLMEERVSAFAKLQSDLSQLRRDEEEHLNQLLKAERDALAARRAQLRNEQAEIEQGRIRLNERQREIERQQREVEVDREILREDREALEAKVERRAAARIERKELEKSTVEAKLEAARAESDRLRTLLAKREEQDRRYGHLSQAEMFRRLERLTQENEELKQQLVTRPGDGDMERLRDLEKQGEDWELERARLLSDLNTAEKRLANYQIGCVELETLRDQKTALEASRELLEHQLSELRGDVERMIGEGGRTSFPACLEMDEDRSLQTGAKTDSVPQLDHLVNEVRHRIANDDKLYYALSDIRSFLAGLSASYLTILQGISGTGKTSMPKALARAVGGGCNIIEVQAGWRERADLIGHYNSFEGKFYEQKFLRALYRAQCPAYEDRLFLVVLDEMNLSYVEQYFADLLSVMERPESEHRLELMTEPLTDRSVPRLLDKGCSLRIPPNVRFIGTANQDETTKDIADKTYGRAHILELPIKHPQFKPDAPNSSPPRVSYRSLEEAFDAARRKHREDAEASYDFLQGRPRNVLMQRFGVGWGNRLEKQVRSYVPVILASGGSIGEATDYILALKLLRKTRDRYEYQKEDFEILKDTLEGAWLDLEDEAWIKPKKSIRVIEAELRRK